MREKFLFIGGVASEEQLKFMEIIYGKRPVFSSDPLQISILQGLYEWSREKVHVCNLVFYPTPKSFFRSKESTFETSYAAYHNIPFICGKVVQHFSKSHNLLKYLMQLSNERTHIIIYSAYFPFLQAIWNFKKKRNNVDVCLIVPDLPQFSGLNSQKSLYKRVSRTTSTALFNKYNSCIDSYVLLTEQMNDIINPYFKKHIVIEGIASSEYVFNGNQNITNNIVYSGTLQFKYGIGTLLEAASLVKDTSVHFLFYGDGEARNAIIEASKKDSRIEYHSPICREELNKIQQRAKILVNPRQNTNEFTKYSFPSKNIEYLLSGRPVVAYKLDGIPAEYDDYLNYPINNAPQALADIITQLCNQPEEHLKVKGNKGREFVVNNKNYYIQTCKVIDMITTYEKTNIT